MPPTLRKPRNCERCRAYDVTARPNGCALGYNNTGPYLREFGIYRIEPQEPCPKPLSIQAFIDTPKKGHDKRGEA